MDRWLSSQLYHNQRPNARTTCGSKWRRYPCLSVFDGIFPSVCWRYGWAVNIYNALPNQTTSIVSVLTLSILPCPFVLALPALAWHVSERCVRRKTVSTILFVANECSTNRHCVHGWCSRSYTGKRFEKEINLFALIWTSFTSAPFSAFIFALICASRSAK